MERVSPFKRRFKLASNEVRASKTQFTMVLAEFRLHLSSRQDVSLCNAANYIGNYDYN